MTGCSSNKTNDILYEGNLVKNTNEDFIKGDNENTELNHSGEIVLKDGLVEGKYISPILKTEYFNELVASWNVNTPENTEVELSVKVKIEDEWTEYFTYGKWTKYGQRGSVFNQSQKYAKMSIDTLEILYGKDAEAIQYTMELRRNNENLESLG